MDKNINLNKVTRVEVIDEHGRSYTNWNKKNIVSISVQDNDLTLKVFIKKKIEDDYAPLLELSDYLLN